MRHSTLQREGYGRSVEFRFQEGPGAFERGRIRRYTNRIDAFDRPAGADKLGACCQVTNGEGWLQGGHAIDGLADLGRTPRQEGPARCRRLACLPNRMGLRRYLKPDLYRLSELGLRQGYV